MYWTLLVFSLFVFISCTGRQSVSLHSQQNVTAQPVFHGGSGESLDDAMVISGVSKQSDGLDAEYSFICSKYGVKNKEWRLIGQTIVQEHGKVFDVLEIELISSSERRIHYFDVSAFPWKKK